MRFEISQHLGSGIEIRFYLLSIVEIAEHRLQIVDCFGPAVVDAEFLLMMVGRNPHPAPRERRRSAEDGGRLKHHRPQPRLGGGDRCRQTGCRSEEHTSELQSLMRISYAVFCLKKKNN